MALAIENNIEVYQPAKIKEEYQKVYDLLGQSIDLEGSETSPQVFDIYFKATEYYSFKIAKNKILPILLTKLRFFIVKPPLKMII